MRMTIKSQGVAFGYGFAIFIIWYLSGFDWTPRTNRRLDAARGAIKIEDPFAETNLEPNIKYILQWTRPTKEPFTFMKAGQDLFIERRCPVNNCYVTWNRTFLSNLTDYNAVLFYCHDVSRGFIRIPKKRSGHQKYVFVSPEPAAYYPVYHERYNGFFNMTWTYRLDSEVFYGYILVRDREGKKIGPKEIMHWPKTSEMLRINHKLKEKLNRKRIAAAWLVSNCHSLGGREGIALKIKNELKSKYNMTLEIFGACGHMLPDMFWQMLERDYYFYFSFENSISEDYVSEKLLNALQHYMVPIVYGGANYTRFMPDGMYLNARSLTVEELVKQMVNIINDKEKYYDFFRWHNHYTYHYAGDTPDTDYYCEFCRKINDDKFMSRVTIKNDFAKWWNGWNIGE
ncbi:alpha-(1,3)-fucosyltransferase C-like [Helicoverpa zea]|uniref:alpha-(1,3)-fucosyltransferase C-like n=1 Tax=Helicoverpa zea TaxID=7113 RepID=UPI001F5A035A|nr:alpha-(1,3)-fucosyltransferase C-like [Helicoverpa zea]